MSRPSVARVYDYILGGAHNFAVDRVLGDELAHTSPDAAAAMRTNRLFLRRAVRFLARQGMTQYLDIGSGIPTVGNVHEIAQEIAPESTVVYVDVDPVAVAHSETILDGNERVAVLCVDLREPDRIVAEATELGLLDFDRPVAVILVGMVHFLSGVDGPGKAIARLRTRLARGSYLALSHATMDQQPPEVIAAQQLSARTPTPLHPRTYTEVSAFFGDLSMVDPGLVFTCEWRPDSGEIIECPERTGAYAGIGRKA